MKQPDDKIGSAILGFFAAIKICERGGYPWRRVAEMVERETREQRKRDLEQKGSAK